MQLCNHPLVGIRVYGSKQTPVLIACSSDMNVETHMPEHTHTHKITFQHDYKHLEIVLQAGTTSTYRFNLRLKETGMKVLSPLLAFGSQWRLFHNR